MVAISTAGKDARVTYTHTAAPRAGLLGGDERKPRAASAPKKSPPPKRTGHAYIGGHRYLNAAIPRDHVTDDVIGPLQSAVCSKAARLGNCGHAYANLMRTQDAVCEECRGEAWESHKAAFAKELGIGEDEDRGPSIYRVRELAHRANVIGRKIGR